MKQTKVGILGSGVVAQALAGGFLKHGYAVRMGTRDVSKLNEFATQHAGIEVGSFDEAASFGELLVLAVKGTVAQEALQLIDKKHFTGKTIIDTTNPIADKPPVNGVLQFFTSLQSSLMESLQAAHPDAHFVKAFNSIGNAFMVNPSFAEGTPTMFICGNNEDAKKQVALIAEQFGFDVSDMGKVEAARAIEPLCILWCIPGMLRNEWNHAFKLLKK